MITKRKTTRSPEGQRQLEILRQAVGKTLEKSGAWDSTPSPGKMASPWFRARMRRARMKTPIEG